MVVIFILFYLWGFCLLLLYGIARVDCYYLLMEHWYTYALWRFSPKEFMKKNSLLNFLSFLNLTQVHAKSEKEKFLVGLNCWWIEYKGDGDTLVKF